MELPITPMVQLDLQQVRQQLIQLMLMVWHFLATLECQSLVTRFLDGQQRRQVLSSLEHINRQQM
jgi:hypothetical protein